MNEMNSIFGYSESHTTVEKKGKRLKSLFVCLFVFPIITQEPLDRFASNFDWGSPEAHGNVLSLVLRFIVDFNSENLVSR